MEIVCACLDRIDDEKSKNVSSNNRKPIVCSLSGHGESCQQCSAGIANTHICHHGYSVARPGHYSGHRTRARHSTSALLSTCDAGGNAATCHQPTGRTIPEEGT